jgi:hypothetical protein
MPPFGGPVVPGGPGGGQPEEKKVEEATVSRIVLKQNSSSLEFVLDLVLFNQDLKFINQVSALAASTLRVDMEAAADLSLRHRLSRSARMLGEEGLREAGILKGRYPPGAFVKREGTYTEREPRNRVGWMAGLLPYLGHQTLFSKIEFQQSWRHHDNWLAGSTIVPQFLDPMYPDHTRYVSANDVPLDYGATHFVGLTGVGLDAATYRRGDPRRGVFGYEDSASLEEVRAGRGTSNTILMIQVPHDGITGVSPWMAGGGATLRGVPEKNSIAPFILSKDKFDKTIQHQNRKGTFAVMTDGSVRFIDQNVSDEVFKAMATVGGPTPPNFDKKEAVAPIVPMPEDPKAKPPVEKKPADKAPPEKAPPEKQPPVEKKPADKAPPEKQPPVEKKPVDKAPPVDKQPAEKLPPEKKPNEKPGEKKVQGSIEDHWSGNPMGLAMNHAGPPAMVTRMSGDDPRFRYLRAF